MEVARVDAREDRWLAERLAAVREEVARLDARASALNAQVSNPADPAHERAKWNVFWDLRQRALLMEEQYAIIEAREHLEARALT
jgi:hypothetical protein